MAHAMTHDEWRAFVLAEPARTAKVATVRKDGRSHVAPVWVDLDGDTVVFTTGEDTLKGRTLRRDPRVSLSFDDERPPFSFVIIDGVAELSHDLDELRHWATRLGGRYMGDDQAEAYGQRNAVPGELLVRVTPTNVVAQAAIAD
jgi:PPOX class probable F420-dependent enzyme